MPEPAAETSPPGRRGGRPASASGDFVPVGSIQRTEGNVAWWPFLTDPQPIRASYHGGAGRTTRSSGRGRRGGCVRPAWLLHVFHVLVPSPPPRRQPAPAAFHPATNLGRPITHRSAARWRTRRVPAAAAGTCAARRNMAPLVPAGRGLRPGPRPLCPFRGGAGVPGRQEAARLPVRQGVPGGAPLRRRRAPGAARARSEGGLEDP